MIPVYDYRISSGASVISGTGTITTSIGSNIVAGTATIFLTQAHIGDLLISGGQVLGVIATVTNDLQVILNLPATIAVATAAYSLDPLVNVETLSAPFPFAPRPVPRLWQQDFDLGTGGKRGLGGPSTLWQFGFATQAFRDALRVYCPGSSSSIWIRTRGLDTSTAYLTYSAMMLWPVEEPLDALRRVPFVIQFRAMVIL